MLYLIRFIMTQRVKDSDPEMDHIRKMLSSSGPYPAVKQVAERIFQRMPSLVKDWAAEMETFSATKRKSELINNVMVKIEEFVLDSDKARECGMPNKAEQYCSYIDLVVGIARSATKHWTVFLLKDYPSIEAPNYQMEEEGYELRKKVKSALAELGFRPGVQTETASDRIWFRIVLVKKSKDRKKDQEKMKKSRATMLAYFPGEPYFYAPKNHKTEIGDALVSCLGCSSYTELPLSGKHIDSLRRLRLGRDGRQGPSLADHTLDRFGLFSSEDMGPTATSYPILDKILVKYDSVFKGCEELPDPSLMDGKSLNASLEISGTDVINGLRGLVEAGVVNNPPPKWVSNVATAGRSSFNLVDGGRAVPQRDWDNESVMSGFSMRSDKTRQRQN